MNKLKKNLQTIFLHVSPPKASSREFQSILSGIRNAVPTKVDKINFTLIFASMIFAIIFISPKETYVDKLDQNKQIYIYNFSDAFDPN